jgi:hypothetical protein
MMYPSATGWEHGIYRSDDIPPTTVPKRVKESKQWQKAMLDAFENIAVIQFSENLEFYDYYRMVDGELSYQDLSEVSPQYSEISDLLDGVGIPTFLKHYDIMGLIINTIVGKYVDLQSKFHLQDFGEVAENEYLRFRNEEITRALTEQLNLFVERKLAEEGFDSEGKQFESEEEQQQYLQALEQRRAELTPKDLEKDINTSFKTSGVKWGEAVLDKDKIAFNLTNKFEKTELKDKLISGRYFRHYRLRFDTYEPERWDPRSVFHSKELDADLPQKQEYLGRLHFMTPAEVIRLYGHLIDTKLHKDLIGGRSNWKDFVGTGVQTGTINQAIKSNFVTTQRAPFSNYYDYNLALSFQDTLGIPMGEYTSLEPGNNGETYDRMLPRMIGESPGRYNRLAEVLRNDFEHRTDLCQVTEVYCRCYDLYGYLTYENEYGRLVTELVDEEILPQFLKDNNIKQDFKSTLVDIIKGFEPNTIKWFYKPVTYEGVKIQSGNLKEPLYLYFKQCEHQIKGDSEMDTLLPVGGFIGKSPAKKMAPYQAAFNLCMNQVFSMLEKELGMFFLMDINLLPSEMEGWGDAGEAFVHLRNIAKDTGIFPVQTSGDSQKNANSFNQFGTHSLSYASEINTRIQLAEFYQRKAYEVIGINPQMQMEPTKYETAEGVRVSQEASFAQLSEIFEDFDYSNMRVLELHLAVAQYAQTNKKDLSLYWTKSDSSIGFLQLSDPYFPLRRMGLLPSNDSKKRKQLEEFKNYLMQTNTIGSDTLEIAKLFMSDTMSQLLQIAEEERKSRQQAEEQAHTRQLEIQEQQAQIEEQKEQKKWERAEISKERDRAVRKEMEVIEAMGRTGGKDNFAEANEQILRRADQQMEEKSLNLKAQKDAQDFKLKEKQNADNFKLKLEELKLKSEQLAQRAKEMKSKEYIAAINKN